MNGNALDLVAMKIQPGSVGVTIPQQDSYLIRLTNACIDPTQLSVRGKSTLTMSITGAFEDHVIACLEQPYTAQTTLDLYIPSESQVQLKGNGNCPICVSGYRIAKTSVSSPEIPGSKRAKREDMGRELPSTVQPIAVASGSASPETKQEAVTILSAKSSCEVPMSNEPQCTRCGKAFKTPAGLKQHTLAKHT